MLLTIVAPSIVVNKSCINILVMTEAIYPQGLIVLASQHSPILCHCHSHPLETRTCSSHADYLELCCNHGHSLVMLVHYCTAMLVSWSNTVAIDCLNKTEYI
ncbi:hypothetical protein K492DRAFT_32285 [Lichtheimia hyalospora FSU 10163]|nr:hypothetical protein K492DRAFT_32285 [Lichtheimia hyalospora FSU 10163]